MIEIYSQKKSNQLLHIVNKLEPQKGREALVGSENFLQVMTLSLNAGQSFPAHKHIWKNLEGAKTIAQESWVVISGKIKVDFFDIDDTFLCSYDLSAGDASITLFGGHSYQVLENSFVYEFKSGPYLGQDKDKVFI
jgi:hypothetical protein